MKTNNLEKEIGKIFKDNPDFVFYDYENECVGKDLIDYILNREKALLTDIIKMVEGKKWKSIENIDIDKKMKKALISVVNFTIQDILNNLNK